VTDLERAAIVRENLATRVGLLTAENLDLLVRNHELEEQLAAATAPSVEPPPTSEEPEP
jgi:hypothetical protein